MSLKNTGIHHGDAAANALALLSHHLLQSRSMRMLSLQDNHIGDEGAQQLLELHQGRKVARA